MYNISNKSFRYQLDRSSRKFPCPSCHKKTFVRIVDIEEGEYISEEFGRCDRQNNCAYSRYPKKGKQSFTKKKLPQIPLIAPDKKELMYFSFLNSNFHKFCRRIGITNTHLKAWKVGSKRKTTVFGIFNQEERHINSKHVPYYLSGKRKRNVKVAAWYLKAPEGYRHEKHLYGLHLFDPKKDTVLVESEKTAVLASYFYPGYNWLATGGAAGTLSEKINEFFIGRSGRILYLSDNDRSGMENKTVKTLEALAQKSLNLSISIINPFPDQKEGYDLGDFISREYRRIQGDLEEEVLGERR